MTARNFTYYNDCEQTMATGYISEQSVCGWFLQLFGLTAIRWNNEFYSEVRFRHLKYFVSTDYEEIFVTPTYIYTL